jgi:hypothetical protein
MVCTTQAVLMLLGWQYPLLESNTERESGECESHVCMVEWYVVDKIEEGVNIFMRPFIDDSTTVIQKVTADWPFKNGMYHKQTFL